MLLVGLDLWRWHRLATSMGLQRMGSAAADEGFNPMGAYRGEFEGRQVTLDHIGNQEDVGSNWTRVAAHHDGDADATLVVRERGLGGMPDSEFPPSVDVPDGALTDRFHVYCEDAGFARALLTGHVRELLADAETVDEVNVTDDTAVSKQKLQPFDPEVIREHMRVATSVAEAVESASHRARDA